MSGSSWAADAIVRGAVARTLPTLAAIELSGLTSAYRGKLVAVDDVTLTVPAGTVIGLLARTAPARQPRLR